MATASKRPRVICHMVSSANGKILTENWHAASVWPQLSRSYESFYNALGSQAWLCGRVTMERDFAAGTYPTLQEPGSAVSRPAFVGNPAATSFAIAVDATGKLAWDSNEVQGDHLIVVLTEQVSDAYLFYLQQRGISYLLAGREILDFHLALEQLAALFPITTIALQGGGHLNGSLLGEGLVDELSLLIAPLADAAPGPTSFELVAQLASFPAVELRLTSMEQLEGGLVWLKYAFA
jgi:riboflavin biosynthesis pyrimidine reductase